MIRKLEISWRQAAVMAAIGALLMLTMQALWPDDSDVLEIQFPNSFESHEEAALLRAAWQAFTASCPALQQHAPAITDVEATIYSGGKYDYRTEQYGWPRYVWFQVKGEWPTRGFASSSPSPRPGGVMSGHTLHFYLGVGERPGLLAKKSWSQWFCGMPVSADGSDVFVSQPDFAKLRNVGL